MMPVRIPEAEPRRCCFTSCFHSLNAHVSKPPGEASDSNLPTLYSTPAKEADLLYCTCIVLDYIASPTVTVSTVLGIRRLSKASPLSSSSPTRDNWRKLIPSPASVALSTFSQLLSSDNDPWTVPAPQRAAMSCCAPKAGLARFAEHPGVILFAYLCALLPLAAIYALDFINKDWKSVRDTRRGGQLHLAFSLPPLAVVVFYIHLQRLDEDYKEMATAITAAILCILHVLRTVWGLVQLRAFKEWNVHALQVLVRMGFDAPIYVSRDEARISLNCKRHRRGRYFASPLQNQSLRNPVSNWFAKFVRSAGELLGLEKPEMVSVRNRSNCFCQGNGPNIKQIERTIDVHMVVNNSLVDNEFSGADLPCRPNFALLRNLIPKTWLRAADFLTCRKPEECAVRWTVSFLARFGSEWLIGATQPPIVEKYDWLGRDLGKKENLANRLAAYMACNITHTVDIELEGGEKSSQQVSILSPLHVMCSDLLQPWVPILKVTDKICLPYQLRGGSESKEVQFENHTLCMQNCVSAWPNEFLNELKGKAEKDAVLNMSPHQVAWFSKLIEEQDARMLVEIREMFFRPEKYFLPSRMKSFFWQLGYECEQKGTDDTISKDIISNAFCSMPVLKEALGRKLGFGCEMFQASVHVDNWLALQAGRFPVTSNDVQDEFTEVEVRQYGQVFMEQNRLEMRRLQFKVASENGEHVGAVGKIKFLGCAMELVRSSLAKELRECQDGSDSTSYDDWSPVITEESCTVVCSDQLYWALRETDSGKMDKADSELDDFAQKALQMRVLWETQRTLISSLNKGRRSSATMMLCMLGYPSLRISKIHRCPPMYPSAERNTTEDVSIPVDGAVETDGRQMGPIESSAPARSSNECREENRSCLRIDIVEAPQPLHITFQWTSESNEAAVQIGVNEGHTEIQFYWQRWKDGFMGRLCAQSNWRSTRLYRTNEIMRKEGIVSKLTEGLSEFSRYEMRRTCWLGWPPFLSLITQFERNTVRGHRRRNTVRGHPRRILPSAELEKVLDRISGVQLDEISDSQGIETEINALSPEPECDCSCKGHALFLEAKELLENGKEEESLNLFRDCIVHHKHLLALEQYVSIVINKSVYSAKPDELVRDMRDAVERSQTENMEINCRKFQQYDLESVIELLDNAFEKSGNGLALYWKAQILDIWSSDEYSADERCIEAFESLVLQEDPHKSFLECSRTYLAMRLFQSYCSTGKQSDKDFGIQHCIRLSNGEAISDCAGIAFLIEKGSVSVRECDRAICWLKQFDLSYLEKVLKNIFLWTSNIEHRMSRNTNAAFTMYRRVIPEDTTGQFTLFQHGMIFNRLALMYHRGVDGVVKDFARAQELYTAVSEINLWAPQALCNLGVLYGQRNWSMRNAEKSVKFFRDAIQKFEEREERYRNLGPLHKHSSSMSNLAVIMELGEGLEKDIEDAKKLYLRAVEIDENPIAMYNLAVLLKFRDLSGENVEKAEELFAAVANLGLDLQSTPVLAAQLEKARLLTVIEPTTVFHYDVDEIDDCLTYVKIIDSSA